MKQLSGFFLFIASVSIAHHASASVSLNDLTKVSPENKTVCVEYYIYKGDLYCSNKAKSSQALDPNILNHEKQNIEFDNRVWRAAWGKQTPTITTIEYVPEDDDIEHWNELITTQFIPLQNDITPKEFMDIAMQNLKKTGYDPIIKIIDEKPNELIFEFRIKSPESAKQDELQKIVKTDQGLHILHYVIKKDDMGEKSRAEWVEHLKNSTVKTNLSIS